jgi:type II secretory pathway component PulM
MSVLVAAVMLYTLLIQPLTSGLENRRNSVMAKTDLLGWMHASAERIQRARGAGLTGTGKRGDRPAYVLLDKSIRNAGLSASADRIEPAGKGKLGARVQFSQVNFDTLVGMLGALQSQYGLIVVRANITQKANGLVSAQITLEDQQ